MARPSRRSSGRTRLLRRGLPWLALVLGACLIVALAVLTREPAPIEHSATTTNGSRDRAFLPMPRPAPPAEVERAPAPVDAPTWRRYAARPAAPGAGPMIAVVIDDLGPARVHALRAINLPGPLTLAFLPYAERVDEQAALAAQAGHELLVHVPMEPESSRENPGPHVLKRGLGADENLRRLRWGLAQFDGYVGINNHMGSRFSADGGAMDLVMEELRRRGLLFLDSRTTALSRGEASAERAGVPNAVRHVFLDNEQDADHVRRQLARLEAEARRRGYAVAIGHPHPATLDALEHWLPSVGARGFRLVPISAVVDRRIQLAVRR